MKRRISRGTALAAVAAMISSLGAAVIAEARKPLETRTDPSRVQACLPLSARALLVGGHGGLAVLDGEGRVRQWLTALSGLPGTRVHALLATKKGVLVGTERGLARFVRRSDGMLRLVGRRVGRPVRALARHRGEVYVGTWGAGLARLSPAGARGGIGRLVTLRGGARVRVTSLLSTKRGLFVGSAGRGLFRLVASRLREAKGALPSRFVWSLAERQTSTGRRLVVGTLNGVFTGSSGSPARFEQTNAADARALVALDDGRLLIGSYGRGLGELASIDGRARWSTAAGRYISVLAQAASGLCVGSRQGAFFRASRASRATAPLARLPLPQGLHANDLTALAQIGGTLYLGSFDGGLAAIEGNARAGRRLATIAGADRRIDALAVQRRGDTHRLWIGTARGLYRYDPPRAGKKAALRHFGRADGLPHLHVHSLTTLRDGRVVAGTGRGLAIIDGESVRQINFKQGLPVASVWAVVQGRGNVLWVGTSKGLYRWSHFRRQRFSVASGHLPDDWVTALTVRGETVFVGTYNAGVVRLDPAPAVARGAAKSASKRRARHRRRSRYTSRALGGGWINFGGLRVIAGRWLVAATMSGVMAAALGKTAGEAGATQLMRLDAVALGKDVTAVLAAGDKKSLWIASRRGLTRQPLSILPRAKDPDGC